MDFSSNIVLLANDSMRIQAIYASQLYGTFFGVFANFNVEKFVDSGGKTDKNKLIITKINFTLINYKGEKNLKIIQPFKSAKYFHDDITKGFSIELLVQHTTDANPIQRGIELDLGEFFSKTKGAVINKGDYFRVVRKLIKMNNQVISTAPIKQKAFANGVFDSEFYVRDGNFANPRSPELNYDSRYMIEPDLGFFPSPSCIPANNKIHF